MKPFLRNFLTAATIAGAASAQVPGVDGVVVPPPAVVFSEIVINPPGTDEGFESIELTGTPGLPLSGWWILAIEGDGTTAGLVDVRISLGAYVLGANGVLLLRDAATDFGQGFNSAVSTVYLPVGPNAATTRVTFNFTPDIENGTNTYILGFGTPPAAAADLDTNNDGVLDAGALAAFTVVDAVTLIENDTGSNLAYAAGLGFTNVGPNAGFNADALYRLFDGAGAPSGWIAGDMLSSTVAPIFTWGLDKPFFDPASISGNPFGVGAAGVSSFSLDLGRRNVYRPNLTLSAPGGPTTFSLDLSGAESGAFYFTGVSFDPLNTTIASSGIHAGLHIPAADLAVQQAFGPPFFGALDAAGAYAFSATGLPDLTGITIYAATLVYSPTYGDINGRSSVVALTF